MRAADFLGDVVAREAAVEIAAECDALACRKFRDALEVREAIVERGGAICGEEFSVEV